MDTETQTQTETNQAQLRMQFRELLENEPRLIRYFVPSNGEEQKAKFMSGETRNPHHTYDQLDTTDFVALGHSFTDTKQLILANPSLNPKYRESYEAFTDDYIKKARILELAAAYNHANEREKPAIKAEYMQLNVELYGEPNEATYRSLLVAKVERISKKTLDARAKGVYDELLSMVELNGEAEKKYAPHPETIAWMHEVVEGLYGGMLAHVPDQESFDSAGLKSLFEQIIHSEFVDEETGTDAAEDWTVIVQEAKSINVDAAKKMIIIPPDRQYTKKRVRQLIVHELGVHMLRSTMGSQTDLDPLALGLVGYSESEEGQGVVNEQALDGMYREAGASYYITAGLISIDGNDFRSTFEAKWRLNVLTGLKSGAELTDIAIAKAKESAYSSVMRFMRGTDELPLFMNLAYYNGARIVWEYLDEIRRDDLRFTEMMLGRSNSLNPSHRRVLYETHTV